MRPILADGELSASIRRAIRGGLSIMASDRMRSGGESPGERLAAAQRLQLGLAEWQRLRHRPGELLERHGRLVRRRAVPASFGMATNKTPVTLKTLAWTVPESWPFGEAELEPLRGGETLAWRLAA